MDAIANALPTTTALVETIAQPLMVSAPDTPLARLKALPQRQQWMLGAGLAGLLAVLLLLALLNREDRYAPLFTGAVTEKDAGAAVAQLRQMDVPFRISEGNNTILVPIAKAGELRMRMASAGLPKGSVTGFELLDNPRFGMSQQQERTSLQRALEGELTRSVGSLAAVESARVHLAMPQPNGFFREQVKPSASVVLALRPGHLLDRSQIAGIVHLVSSSVPDLSPKAVSVIDQEGSLLSQSPDQDGRQDLTQQQRKHVTEIEQNLLKRVNDILEPTLGRDNLRATVTAELDFNQVETTSEAFRPNQTPDAAAVRSQRSVEAGGPGQTLPSGVPGAASNTPPTPATAPMAGASQPLQGAQASTSGGGNRRENQTNYEVDRKVDVTRNAVGVVRRVNVAVVVNHRSVTDKKGTATPQALPAEELEKLTTLVQEAVGFNQQRGDSVKVVNMPFRADLNPKPAPLPLWQEPWVLQLVKTAGPPLALLLVALILVFAVIRPAMKKDKPAEAPAGAALNAVVDDQPALPDPSVSALMPPDEEVSQDMVLQLEDARLLARTNPLAVANILRGWVHGPEDA